MKGGISVDWNVLKAEYIAGGTNYRKLAEKYGVSHSKLMKVGAREGWAELRKKNGRKTEEKIIDSISDSQSEAAVSAASLINEAAMNFLKQIAEESVKIKEGKLNKDITTKYSEYALALARFKDVLGIKSDRDIEEQDARIANLKKQAEKDSITEDKTFTVEFGESEEYSI